MVNGKAKLLREDYCDGLGDCLPACPVDAISFELREALAYNEEAVLRAKQEQESLSLCGCPGSQSRQIEVEPDSSVESGRKVGSQLRQWPVQIKLAPVSSYYFNGADLLIAADCTAYAYGSFHNDFMKSRITLIGCPKLDMVDYAHKLTQIIMQNDIRSITVIRMEVPCCGGIENAVRTALQASGKMIPWQVFTVSTDGKILK
jgi:ferredoxin